MFVDRKLFKRLLATVSASAISVGSVVANPLDPTVQSGNVSIEGLGTADLVIGNNSMRSVVDWDSFSIGTGEVTTINQISNDAAILNRVTGGNVSEIYGTLQSNGQVLLVNESGILVGPDGIIDTNGFVASTLDVSNADFLAGGDLVFKQGVDVGGGIEVHGKIRSVSGGDIFLLSREITVHEGAEISSKGGYVGLAAGEEILLRPTDSGDGRISIRAGKGSIKNSGAVEAAVVELRAAGGNEYALAINNTGVIRATGATHTKGGRVLLTGGGTVKNSGKIYANRKVVVRSKKKIVNVGTIKLPLAKPDDAQIVLEAPDIVVEAGSVLDVSAALGGGRIYIGGGKQGQDSTIDNASLVTIEAGATIKADALENGDGGEVIVWSDDTTIFAGDISAQGTGDGDGGFVEVSGKQNLAYQGFVDTRAENGQTGTLLLDPGTFAIYDESAGSPLDAATVAAAGGSDTTDGDSDGLVDLFDLDNTDTSNTTIINAIGDDTLSAQLAATSVTLSTSTDSGNNGTEDILITAGVRVIWNTVSPYDSGNDTVTDKATTLELVAGNDIQALNDIIIQNTETGNGTTNVVTGTGGVVLKAGGDINIGDMLNSQTAAVSIGSEFGQTTLLAGYDNGSGSFNADGSIYITSGDTAGAFSQVGYRQNEQRGNNTGEDYTRTGVHAANGDITVSAGGDVIVFAGDGDAAFAQIGHGGTRATTTSFAEIVSSDISVSSGNYTSVTDAHVRLETAGNESAYAQIGHGAVLANALQGSGGLHQDDISGDISVTAVTNGDIRLNTSADHDSDGNHDQFITQIGHGAHAFYADDGSANEVVIGRISGDIDISATSDGGAGIFGAVLLGEAGAVDPAASDNRFTILSQIGHGAYVRLTSAGYDGDAATGDNDLTVSYGAIANFIDIAGNGNSTDITVNAAQVTLVAINETENSASKTGDVFDNMIRNQIGHGSFTRFESGATADIFGYSEERIDSTTNIPTAQASGSYDEEVTYTNENNVSTGAAGGVEVQNLSDTIIEGLSDSEAAALAAFMATDPADGDVVPATVDGVSYTTLVAQNSSDIDLEDLVNDQITCGAGCTVADLANVDTSGWTAVQLAALDAFLASAPTITDTVSDVAGTTSSLDHEPLNITVTEGDITGDIAIYDVVTNTSSGITLYSEINAGNTAITYDAAINRIGHATASFISGMDGYNSTALSDDNNAGTITINQANILGADIIVDTTNGGAITEAQNQDIILHTAISSGLAKAELNTVFATIGHGGEAVITSGDGGEAFEANDTAGHGGDIIIVRGTIWDGMEHYNLGTDSAYSYGGSVNISVTSSDQIVMDNDVSASLAKVEGNNAMSQIGSGSAFILTSGSGGEGGHGGRGGRGGDIAIFWDSNEWRDYGHVSQAYDDYARGIMGDITIEATHVESDGYALSITSDDTASLAKADHNSVSGQIGIGDYFELYSGFGGSGGDLTSIVTTGQVDGGRGGDIDILFAEMKIESDILVDVTGAILAESTATNAPVQTGPWTG